MKRRNKRNGRRNRRTAATIPFANPWHKLFTSFVFVFAFWLYQIRSNIFFPSSLSLPLSGSITWFSSLSRFWAPLSFLTHFYYFVPSREMHSWRTRKSSLFLLTFFFLLDITCSIVLSFSVHDWKWAELQSAYFSSSFGSAFMDFSNDVLDLLACSLIRLVVLLILARITVRYGTARHELELDERKNLVKKREKIRAGWYESRGIQMPTPPSTGDEEEGEAGRTW